MAQCICPNELTRLVTVEKVKDSATVLTDGNVDETSDSNWIVFGREWAKVVTQGSREFVRGEQLGEEASHQWTIRWSNKAAQYTTGMRLRMDGRKFNISAPPVNINERNEWLVINTKEVADV